MSEGKNREKHSAPQAVITLRIADGALEDIQAQLEAGTFFLPALQPLPPDTLLRLDLQNDKGEALATTEAVVKEWSTLLQDEEETWEPPGMRIQGSPRAETPPQQAPGEPGDTQQSTTQDLATRDLQDASAILAATIDLDDDDENGEPVPLPQLPEDSIPDLRFQDVSELVARQIDLDAAEDAEDELAKKPAAEPGGIEQRQSPRVTVGILLRLQPVGEEETTPVEGRALNISETGIFVRCQQQWPNGAQLLLSLPSATQEAPLQCLARVVRTQAEMGGQGQPCIPGMGLHLLDPSPEISRELSEHLDGSLVETDCMEVEAEALPLPADEARPAVPEQKTSPAEQKRLVVDSLLTAMELSGVRDFKNNETLRYLIEIWYPRYHDAGTVNLGLLWNALASDDSIDHREAALPLFIFSLARNDHGLNVVLPENLSRFHEHQASIEQARERLSQAGSFRTAYEQVARANAKRRKERKKKKKRKRDKPLPAWPRTSAPGEKSQKARKPIPLTIKILLAGFALLACATSYFLLLPEQAVDYSVRDVKDILILDEAKVRGRQLQAIIRDPRWAQMDERSQKSVIQVLLNRFSGMGIKSILLLDENLMPAVSAHIASDVRGIPVIRLGSTILREPE